MGLFAAIRNRPYTALEAPKFDHPPTYANSIDAASSGERNQVKTNLVNFSKLGPSAVYLIEVERVVDETLEREGHMVSAEDREELLAVAGQGVMLAVAERVVDINRKGFIERRHMATYGELRSAAVAAAPAQRQALTGYCFDISYHFGRGEN